MNSKLRRAPVDIFVICYERTPTLNHCLQSIKKHTSNIAHRVIVIEGKKSAAENRNIALSKVRSPWFVLMDDDVIVTNGWLDTLLNYISPEIGQIQPKILFPNGKVFVAEKVFITPWGENRVVGKGEKDKGQFDYVRIVELLSGTCSLYNSAILKDCKFDINYKGTQWEDCDFSMQIKKSGFYLLYCGKSVVYHHHFYRNPVNKNYEYFKEKWFGPRELTKRGVIYIGLACDLNCIFCYYKHSPKKTFRPYSEIKQECCRFRRFYGNTHVDISGGEPTIHPDIYQIVEYCRSIELLPTIITHGQRLSKEFVKTLKQAGIEDFLISYHGPEEEHDYLIRKPGGYKRMQQGIENLINAEIPFRINTVVTKINYKTLPRLVDEFLEIKPRVVNFIMFNPFEEWIGSSQQFFQIRYSEASPYVKEAVSILTAQNIETHVRYMPFCLAKGFEKYVMNFPQMPYDKWEWDFKPGHPLRGEYDYLYYALRESCIRYAQGIVCQECSLKLICSGLPKQYARVYGWDELNPQLGLIVRDPLYFKTKKSSPPIFSPKSQPPFNGTIEDVVKVYPWLSNSDPLILHHLVPMENLKPLFTRREIWIRNIFRVAIDILKICGGRWLKRAIPSKIQKWMNRVIKRMTFY